MLSHEGRQHAIRNLGGESDDETSVEVVTPATLGGKVVFPDERNAETFHVSRRETFLLRGRTLADFINKTKTEKWKALAELLGLDAIEGLRQDLQRARNDIEAGQGGGGGIRTYRRALASGAEDVTRGDRSRQPPADLPRARRRAPQSLEQVADPSWLTAAVGARATASEASDRESLLAEIRTLSHPAFDEGAVAPGTTLVSSDRARLLPRASLVREAKRLFEAGSVDKDAARCAGRRSTPRAWRRIESALVDVMEASRGSEGVRERSLELADDLEAAHRAAALASNRARSV